VLQAHNQLSSHPQQAFLRFDRVLLIFHLPTSDLTLHPIFYENIILLLHKLVNKQMLCAILKNVRRETAHFGLPNKTASQA
jgi:hypothetical protein